MLVIWLFSVAILASCTTNSSDRKDSTPPVAVFADADGNCSGTTQISFVETASNIESYDKDPSSERLQKAGQSCEAFQTLVGEQSCLMTASEPQISLNKDALGQTCSSIKAKIQSAQDELSLPKIDLDQVLNEYFSSPMDQQSKITGVNANSGHQSIQFKMGKKTEHGTPFSISISCGYYDVKAGQGQNFSTGLANGDEILIKNNGDLIVNCGTEELKLGLRTKNKFSFYLGYCGQDENMMKREKIMVDMELLSAEKLHMKLSLPPRTTQAGAITCTSDLLKKTKE